MKKSIYLLSFLALVLFSTSVYAAPSISITKPTTYSVYSTSGTIVEASVSASSPPISSVYGSFNGSSIGTFSLYSGNLYRKTWFPTSSQHGIGTQTLRTLQVSAVDSSGGSSTSSYIYVSELDSAGNNSIASSWTIKNTSNVNYNCLAFALGNTSTWEWQWGASNPTVSQVNTFMTGKGYVTATSSDAKIIAYGSTSNVTHFSKKTGASTIDAKWGQLEVMTSTSLSPYTSVYGPAIAYYK